MDDFYNYVGYLLDRLFLTKSTQPSLGLPRTRALSPSAGRDSWFTKDTTPPNKQQQQ